MVLKMVSNLKKEGGDDDVLFSPLGLIANPAAAFLHYHLQLPSSAVSHTTNNSSNNKKEQRHHDPHHCHKQQQRPVHHHNHSRGEELMTMDGASHSREAQKAKAARSTAVDEQQHLKEDRDATTTGPPVNEAEAETDTEESKGGLEEKKEEEEVELHATLRQISQLVVLPELLRSMEPTPEWAQALQQGIESGTMHLELHPDSTGGTYWVRHSLPAVPNNSPSKGRLSQLQAATLPPPPSIKEPPRPDSTLSVTVDESVLLLMSSTAMLPPRSEDSSATTTTRSPAAPPAVPSTTTAPAFSGAMSDGGASTLSLGSTTSTARRLFLASTKAPRLPPPPPRPPLAVFKPALEEVGQEENPHGNLESERAEEFAPGTGYLREVLAYELDHGGFAGVPPTVAVHLEDKGIGSLQSFVPECKEAADVLPGQFSVEAVHRIALFDLRVLNADRHGGNLLVPKQSDPKPPTAAAAAAVLPPPTSTSSSFSAALLSSTSLLSATWTEERSPPSPRASQNVRPSNGCPVVGDANETNQTDDGDNDDLPRHNEDPRRLSWVSRNSSASTTTTTTTKDALRLVPIDHGLIAPSSYCDPEWEWLAWPQSTIPFSAECRAYTASLNPTADARRTLHRLKDHDAAELIWLLGTLLQHAVPLGYTPREIGTFCRRATFTQPAPLELLLAACRRPMEENATVDEEKVKAQLQVCFPPKRK